MQRALLLIENKRHSRQLQEWLKGQCETVGPEVGQEFPDDLDLVIMDGPSLKRLGTKVRARRLQDTPVFLPFVLLLQRRKGSIPSRYLGELVDEVILKPLDKREVSARVANLLRMREMSLDLKKKHDQVARLSVTDDVSGFRNSRYLHRYLDRLLASASSYEKQVSLIFFDLDNFKLVVDEHGHLLGAKVLRQVAEAVNSVLDEEDRIVRYGGDEFIIILPRQNKEQAIAKSKRMKEAISTTPFLAKEGLNVHVTASFGLATFPEDATEKRELLAEADRCLFDSKRTGKNRISVAESPSLSLAI